MEKGGNWSSRALDTAVLEQVEAIAQDNLSGYLRSRFMQLDLRALSPGFSGLPVIAAHQSMVE